MVSKNPMPDTRSIPPVDLLIDAENPRLIQANTGQRDAQREIAQHQGKKLLVLARDILANGLNPSELPIVTPLKHDDLKRFTVLEGNRRLTALKALENPEWLVGAVDKSVVDGMRELSKQYQKNPTETVLCLVVKDREEARHWIELRHTGENEGAGIVRWGGDESARFSARSKGLEIHSLALNFLEERGHLTPQERSKVPTASYRRLLATPEVRTAAGVEVVDGELKLLGEEKAVAKALLHIADDLSSGRVKTEAIYHKKDRVRYAKNLPADVVVKLTHKPGEGVSPGASSKGAKPAKRTPKAKRRIQRDILIPRECILNITDGRIADIADELRRLSLDGYKNAVSVMFRVFLELSIDTYIAARSLTPGAEKLRVKMQSVVSDLVTRTKLTQQQAKPLRRALQKESFLAPSIDEMNEYVHSAAVYPAPVDLRAYWDTLQPFFIAVWST